MPNYNPDNPNSPTNPNDLRDLFDVGGEEPRLPVEPQTVPEPSLAADPDVAAFDVTAASDVGVDTDAVADSNLWLEPDDAWELDYAPDRRLSVGIPSKPLVVRLPLSRIIAQDVHSVFDYLDGATVLSGAFMTSCPEAKAASWVLGGAGIVASALTDYRLSLAKVVPIEKHEIIDYAFGVSAIAAPFILGYRKTAPLVAMTHIAIGIGTLLVSLFTDYRAYRGVGRFAMA